MRIGQPAAEMIASADTFVNRQEMWQYAAPRSASRHSSDVSDKSKSQSVLLFDGQSARYGCFDRVQQSAVHAHDLLVQCPPINVDVAGGPVRHPAIDNETDNVSAFCVSTLPSDVVHPAHGTLRCASNDAPHMKVIHIEFLFSSNNQNLTHEI